MAMKATKKKPRKEPRALIPCEEIGYFISHKMIQL